MFFASLWPLFRTTIKLRKREEELQAKRSEEDGAAGSRPPTPDYDCITDYS